MRGRILFMKKSILKSISSLVAAVMAAGVFAFVPGGAIVLADGDFPGTNNTPNAGSYTLSEDITVSESIQIGSGRAVTVDLNGHSITMDNTVGKSVFNVNGTLTITDSVGGGSVIGNDKEVSTGGGIVHVNSGAAFNLQSGTLCNGRADNGGGVYVNGGTFTMTGGTISGCNATAFGGGVSLSDSATFTLSGGTIENNNSVQDGGGIYIEYGCELHMSNATVTGNTASRHGGGIANRGLIYLSGNPVVTGNTGADNSNNLTMLRKNNKPEGQLHIEGSLNSEANVGLSFQLQNGHHDVVVGGSIGANSMLYTDDPEHELSITDGQVTVIHHHDHEIARVAGHSLSLSGNIGVNYYVTLSDAVENNLDGYIMKFYVGSETEPRATVGASAATRQGDYFIFPVEVFAKEMTTNIRAELIETATDNAIFTDNYTVRDYAASILAEGSGYTQATKDLVINMIEYGAAAQNRLGYNTADLANNLSGYEGTFSTTYQRPSMEGLPEFQTPVSDSENVSFYGAGLILRTQPFVRLYFRVADGADLTFYVGEDAVTPVAAGTGYVYIDLPSLAPKAFGNVYEITVADSGSQAMSFTYSARNYFSSAYASGDTTWSALASAMEGYYQTAKAY